MAISDMNRDEGDGRDEADGPIETPFGTSGGPAGNDISGNEDALELDEASEQLALSDDDERLPWLDADDDDGAEEADGGRILGLVVLGLIALATIVGGIWWSTHRNPDTTLIADGSTIAAPSEAYKEAPKVPGGKTFDGTGNTAFAVSEGQDRPGKLGEAPPPASAAGSTSAAGNAAPRPGFDLGKGPAGAPPPPPPGKAPVAAASAPAAAAAPATGPAVQVGAYSTRATAEAGWSRLAQQYSALSGMRYRIVEGKADIGTVFRLQAVPGDGAAAQALCGRLKSAGLACQVK